jgi:hypothetical protein
MWPIQVAFLVFIIFRVSSPPSLFVTFLHFSHDQSNWSSPSLSITTLQNFPSISDLLFKVSKFQHHTKSYSKCSTLTDSSLNLSPVWWWQVFFLLNAAFAISNLDWISLYSLKLQNFTKPWNHLLQWPRILNISLVNFIYCLSISQNGIKGVIQWTFLTQLWNTSIAQIIWDPVRQLYFNLVT